MPRSLTTIARELNSKSEDRFPEARDLPALLFMTDETRTPDPASFVGQLPEGTAIVFRHYQDEDRVKKAVATAKEAQKRSLPLLIADDFELAIRLGAEGVHLPEHAVSKAERIRRAFPEGVITAAVHSEGALKTLSPSIDAAILSPIFPTGSHPGAPALGLSQAGHWATRAKHPTYALGGITSDNAPSLLAHGFCGIAGISIFLRK